MHAGTCTGRRYGGTWRRAVTRAEGMDGRLLARAGRWTGRVGAQSQCSVVAGKTRGTAL